MESVPGAVATRSPSRFQARCTTTRSLPRLRENSLDTTGFSRVVHQLQPNQSRTLFGYHRLKPMVSICFHTVATAPGSVTTGEPFFPKMGFLVPKVKLPT